MTEEPFARGDVVWHPAPFKSGPQERPYVVVTGTDHPFYGEEYGVVALTRTDRPPAVELPSEAWALGDPGGESYASPWYFFTLKHRDITRPKGRLTDAAVDSVAERVAAVVGAI